jgi:class 3 adenylate cyclase
MNALMVVDDEEGVRRSLKKIFEKDGYEILLAEDGEHAIRMAEDKGSILDTVISDYRMPGINGLETLVRIGEINPEITRIVLTGYATMENAIEAVNAGIDGFVTKPFENVELRAKVRECNVKKRLKQFVSEQVMTMLQKDARDIMPQRKQVSVLFIDIRDFSRISEHMDPTELSDLLNRYFFAPVDSIIHGYNGTLDKHIGDGIMAVFGAPITYEDDAQRAVLCAVSIREEMSKINSDHLKDTKFSIGIGISTGDVMAGIFGSSKKKEYTVFGSSVNLAARLESSAKDNQILICEETYKQVKESMQVEQTLPFVIKGIERKLNIYNVVGKK